MKGLLVRLATIAGAVPAAVVLAGPAYAEPVTLTVPGCYGAVFDETIVCNLTITAAPPEIGFEPVWIKVCVGSCHEVPVATVVLTSPAQLCYAYTDGAGRPAGDCIRDILGAMPAIKPLILERLSCEESAVICASG
jgi:hypothetical protein